MSVAAYADHLRAGGRTTWQTWLAEHPSHDIGSGPIGATHLEVVRRLPEVPRFADLADRVLATPVPGRGAVDIPLPGTTRAFGAPAVQPESLPARELIRLAAAVLADMGAESQAPEQPGRERRRRWRGPAITVHGSPLTARIVRRSAYDAGVRIGGRGARPIVLAGPFEAMMLEHWSAQVLRGRMVRWQRVWAHAAAVDRAPGAVDLLTTLTGLPESHVVVAADPVEAVRLVLALVGRESAPIDVRPGVTATEARRWVNRARPGASADLPLGDDQTLAAPAAQAAWARAAAGRLREGLAGYAVHGDPALLTQEAVGTPRTPDVAAALDLTLAAIGATWKAAV